MRAGRFDKGVGEYMEGGIARAALGAEKFPRATDSATVLHIFVNSSVDI